MAVNVFRVPVGAVALLSGALFLGGGGSAAAPVCEPRIDAAHLVEPGHLTMATSPTLPPMAYADQRGELKGLRIEIGVAVAQKLCLEPDYISTEYATMVPGLNGQRWDMVNAGLFVTPERLQILRMIPYESLAISISTAIEGGTPIENVDDLAGKAVSTDIGGYAERKIKELDVDFQARGLEPMNIQLFDNYATVYLALRAGQVDAAVSIDPVAKQYQDRGEFTHALSGLYPTPGSLAFVDPVVAEAVSLAMKELKADGTFDRIMASYGVSPAPGDLDVVTDLD